jgi:uncharacterized protein with GYD domain
MARKKVAKATRPTTQQQLYLCQFSYTAQAWDRLLSANDRERDRIEAVKPLLQLLGGCFVQISIECGELPPGPKEKFVTFGEHDVVALLAFPSDAAAAAFAMAIQAGGAVSSFKTTRLMPWSLGMEAMDAAAQARTASRYSAPRG